MEDLQYINLHVHSIGSLRDGILKIEDLVEFALKHNKKYVAATDHGSISEWIQLYNQCKSNKLTPIFGIELYIHHEREKLLAEREDDPSHLILLALNEIGFYNIIKIHNDAWQHLYRKKKSRIARPIASYDCLFEHHEGIVVTTACIAGRLPKLLLEGNEKEAALYIERMKEVFQDRLFMELMLNDMEKQKILNKKLIKIAMQYDLKTILTSDAHYLRKEDSRTHQLSLLLQSGKTIKDLEEGKAWRFSAQDLWLKTEIDLYEDWSRDYSEDEVFTEEVLIDSIRNSAIIASKVERFSLEHLPRLPKYPDGLQKLEDMVIEGLEQKCREGAIPEDRIDRYHNQIIHEMKTIKNLGFVDYFLLVKDIHTFALENNIGVGPGRGSVSASIVAWLLGITKLDPIKYGFIFERFLNPARKTRMKIFPD